MQRKACDWFRLRRTGELLLLNPCVGQAFPDVLEPAPEEQIAAHAAYLRRERARAAAELQSLVQKVYGEDGDDE